MPNMGYCRFENTAGDLEECYDHWEDELSEVEAKARERILRLCEQILKDDKFYNDHGDGVLTKYCGRIKKDDNGGCKVTIETTEQISSIEKDDEYYAGW